MAAAGGCSGKDSQFTSQERIATLNQTIPSTIQRDRSDHGRKYRRTEILLASLRAAARSYATCIRSHVSSALPNALVSQIAISGLMPDLPFTTLLSACRVTPRIFAASVTERPK